MTKSQIDKIGEKLRKTQPPGEALLEQLQEFRAPYDDTLARVQDFVAQLLGLAPTSRIKTVNTIVEKLIRSKTRLSSMQDIAGVRIVLGDEADLESQNAAVAQLVAAFGKAKVDDLRTKPRHGYRAVHVIVHVNSLPVEIQVRTKPQDLWAQGMEKLADKVGRGIRYGEPPGVERVGNIAVVDIVKAGIGLSITIRGVEEAVLELRRIGTKLSTLNSRSAAIKGLKLRFMKIRAENDARVANLHRGLELFHGVVEALSET